MKRKILCIMVIFTFLFNSILYLTLKKENGIKKVNIEEEVLMSKIENIYVYFPKLPDMEFVGEVLEFESSLSYEEKVRRVVKKLTDGPKDDNLISVIPENTVLNKVRINDKIAYLDFSDEFIENHPGGSVGEYNTLYSIVNSLTEIDGIEAVDFSVNGKKFKTYKGHCEFSEPLYRK